MPPPTGSASSALKTAAATFCLALVFFLAILQLCPLLYDADAYYHLAIARIYAERGLVHQLPELRFSLLGSDFGDKELIFHLLLIPFSHHGEAGGRLALALFAALAFAAIAGIGALAVGRWAIVVPFALFAGALDFSWRSVRLRPELFSLTLLLCTLLLVARGRARWAGVLAAVYTWSYTAFQAVLAVAGLGALASGWQRRRKAWALILYPLLGVALALVLHPQFPANLKIWVAQNVSLFVMKSGLDLGSEIEPHAAKDLVLLNLGWLVAALALWRARLQPEKRRAEAVQERTLARALGFSAAFFGVLYLAMARFSIYFYPFATLWVLAHGAAGGGFGGRVRLMRGRGAPLAVGLALAALLALPELVAQSRIFALRTAVGGRGQRLEDRAAFAAAVPAEARVAAPWRSTALYLFLAPQGRYLNVLDPVFMAVPHPEVHTAQQALFAGEEPDLPLVAGTTLDSEYLAVSLAAEPEALRRRLENDPRLQPIYRGVQGLFRIWPDRNADFALSWRVAPVELAPTLTAEQIAALPLYPRARGLAARLEGFVDARRLGASAGCSGFVREIDMPAGAPPERWELAPYGSARLWVDGTLLATVADGSQAVLGRGQVLTPALSPGPHRIAIETCADGAFERSGFYLRRIAPAG